MGSPNNCTECLKVEFPDCFNNLELPGLTAGTDYIAVLTNHFGASRKLEVKANYGGFIIIPVQDLPQGYFTPYGNYTLEVFSADDHCNALEICGKKCVELKFYDGEADTNIIECCGEGSDTQCCGNYTPVETVAGLLASVDDSRFNYLVAGGGIEQTNEGIIYIFLSPLVLSWLHAQESQPLTEVLPFEHFYYFSCEVNLLDSTSDPEESSGCDCSSPVVVHTVGDLNIVVGQQNFLECVITTEGLDVPLIVALLIPDGVIALLESLPDATLIEDALQGEIFDDALFFRFMTCTTHLETAGGPTGGTNPFIIDIIAAAGCEEEAQVLSVTLQYSDIPDGSTVRLYAFVSGVETAITEDVPLSGTGTIDSWTFLSEIDTGTNHVRAVITMPDAKPIVSQHDLNVSGCDEPAEPPAVFIDDVRVTCLGEVQESELEIDLHWVNLPEGTSIVVQAKIEGVTTTISSISLISTGSGSITTGSSGSHKFDEDNQVTLIVTLPDTTTLPVTPFDFTHDCVSHSPGMLMNSAEAYCSDGHKTVDIHLAIINIPPRVYELYASVGGVDTLVANPFISGTNPDFQLLGIVLDDMDAGSNYVRIVVIIPDVGTLEQIYSVTVPDCS